MIQDSLTVLGLKLPDPDSITGDGPVVIFPSALQLDKEQETKLVDSLRMRYDTLCDRLGRQKVVEENCDYRNYVEQRSGKTALPLDIGSYRALPRQRLFDMMFAGDMEWRRWLVGDIFEFHNVVFPVTKRILSQQISRAQNYFFSTDPWFTLAPQGPSDESVTIPLEKFARYKFDKGRVKEAFNQAIEGSFVRGQSVIKTTFKQIVNHHQSFAVVAIGADGEPILAQDGDYIYNTDKWVPEMAPETPEEQQGEMPEGETSAEPEAMVGMLLQRDGATRLADVVNISPDEIAAAKALGSAIQVTPDMITFERRRVSRATTMFKGADFSTCYYRDLLVPDTATDIQSADTVVHIYDEPAVSMVDAALARVEDISDDRDPNPEERLARVAKLVQHVKGRSSYPNAGANMPRANETIDTNRPQISDEGIVHVAEFYVWADVGRGVQESIVVKMDLTTWTPITYDYVSNWTPDGERPFHVVRVNPVEGRWYGRSQIELFWQLQHFLDFQVNKLIALIKKCDTTTMFDRERTVEGKADPGYPSIGVTLTPIKGAVNLQELLQKVDFYNPGIQPLVANIELIQQHMMNLSGVANANDMNSAGLDTAKLATGVRNVERAGQELFSPLLGHLEPGLQSASRAGLLITIAHMDEVEAYEYLEGNVSKIGEIRKNDIAHLDLDVKLELTRYRGEQVLVQSEQASALIEKFYGLPLEVQKVVFPFYRRMLKAMEVQDADEIIQPGIWSAMDGPSRMPAPIAGDDRKLVTRDPGNGTPPVNL